MAGVEWDGMMGNTGEVGEFRKRKKAGSEESVKINVIFAEEREEKNGRCQAPLLADLPWDVVPINSFVLQEHM